MFPHVQHRPPEVTEGGILAPVAGDVAVKLRLPPVPVVAREGSMLGAAVPEAAIHEDSDLGPGEGDVRATGEPPVADSEA
jgi:hypothetical protein